MRRVPSSGFLCHMTNTDIEYRSAAAKFTKAKEAKDASGKNHVKVGIDFKKDDMSFLDENETTISVSYTGGGQRLKARKFLP